MPLRIHGIMAALALLVLLAAGLLFSSWVRNGARLPLPAAETEAAQLPRKELIVPAWGVLKGKVRFQGDLPTPQSLREIIAKHNDATFLLQSPERDLVDQTWRVDPETRGIANVVIWLEPPMRTFFPIPEKLRKRSDTVVLDRPHCQYVPHVFTLFPGFHEGNKYVKTGQTFKVANSGAVNHCVKGLGEIGINDSVNLVLRPGEARTLDWSAQRGPVVFTCDLHRWMKAYGWVFAHPFAAVTREDGSFEIPVVPAGVAVTLHAWHAAGNFPAIGKLGQTITLKAGANRHDITIRAP